MNRACYWSANRFSNRMLRQVLITITCSLVAVIPSSAQFETRSITPSVVGPIGAAVADFNHDGKLDLAVSTCILDNQLSVTLGNGDGTLQPPTNYTVEGCPDAPAIGDFNSDGNLDLVVTDPSGSTGAVALLLGNGDGTFQPPVNFAAEAFSCCVLVGDVNNDGKLDLIMSSGNAISVLLGNGDGTFQEPPIVSTPPAQISAIGIGDFNRDGKLDVVATAEFGSESSAQIMLGNGDGTFTYFASYRVSQPEAVTVADLNKDGNLDLVVVNDESTYISVMLGNGDGSFQPPVDYPASSAIWSAVADVNGDGNPDIVVADFTFPAGVSVLLGKGDGTFENATYYPGGGENRFVAVGDFNNDHLPDIIVPSWEYNNIVVLLNTGVIKFSPTTPLSFVTQLVGDTSPPQSVTLTNVGSEAITVRSIKAQGQFGVKSDCGSRINAGASCEMSVVFSPLSIGSKTGFVSINDTASTKPQVIELTGSATVVTLSPASLGFGTQAVGTRSAPQEITLTNTSDSQLQITNIKLTGADPGDFAITNNCGGQMAPKSSCKVSVTFKPFKKGTRKASVSIYDNGGASPQSAQVSGTGS
jgi:hypothetical protein